MIRRDMAKTTIYTGFLLILLGVILYISTGMQHVTSLIPAFAGVLFAVLGKLAENEKIKKHVMHFVVLLSLLGALGTAKGIFKSILLILGETIDRPNAAIGQGLMSIVLFVFTGLCVKSFIDARRARKSA